MSYETLDVIADAYIPLLLMLFLLGLVIKLYRRDMDFRDAGLHSGFLLILLLVAYGFMFIDKATGIWPRLGLDYSTHTAVAVVLVFSLCTLMPRASILSLLSLFAYIGLMLYQQYHSVLDIISTIVVITPLALLCLRAIFRNRNSVQQA